MEPLFPPKQETFCDTASTDESAADGCVIETDAVLIHPFASVTVTVYVPFESPDKFCVVAPLFHAYVNGAVPPVTVNVTVPLLPPKQETFCEAAAYTL